jgi:hypothetical protein
MLICVDRRAPLVPIGSFSTCTMRFWPSESSFSIGFGLPPSPFWRWLPDVGDVQEGGALEADVDEGRLHAGQHAHHAAEVDVADEAARVPARCARRAVPAHERPAACSRRSGDAGFLRRELVDLEILVAGALDVAFQPRLPLDVGLDGSAAGTIPFRSPFDRVFA